MTRNSDGSPDSRRTRPRAPSRKELLKKCDELIERCDNIQKTSQWDAVEKLRADAIDWLRAMGFPREEWWSDLEKLVLLAGNQNVSQIVRFAREIGLPSGTSSNEQFLHHHMEAARKMNRRLEDARREIELRQKEKSPRPLSNLERIIIEVFKANPKIKQRQLCAKVDAVFESHKKETPLLPSWKLRDSEIRSLKGAHDSKKVGRMVQTKISKLKAQALESGF